MEAVLPRAAWRSLLEHATAVTDPKSPYQPAKQVYLETTHTHLTVRATDLCRGYEGRRLLTAGKPGAICIDAKLLHETLKSFADGEIVVSSDGKSVTITHLTAKRKSRLGAYPAEDYPSWPEVGGDATALPLASLHELVRLTHYAQSADLARPHMAATYFQWSGDTLRVVATNGHQLSTAWVKAPAAEVEALVPAVAIALLRDLPTTGDVLIRFTKTHAAWTIESDKGADRWHTKTVDATFLSWQQVVPQSHDGAVACNRATLLDAISAVGMVTKNRAGGVKCSPIGADFQIRSEDPEVGEMEDTIACEPSGSLPAGFGINSTYIVNVLKELTGEKVEIRLTGELDPIVIRDPALGDRMAAVIMPMRL